jgi:F0F1-type ATP synthase assembly protein I
MSSPIIIFLLIAAVIGIPIYLKKKKNKAKKALASNRRNKDEV